MNNTRWLLPSSLGQMVLTASAQRQLEVCDIYAALRWHACGGRVKHRPHRRYRQPQAGLQGCRVLSACHDRYGKTFWIITEPDRRTTVMLPEEYAPASTKAKPPRSVS